MTENTQTEFNTKPGALRSNATLTLHSKQATKLWGGRKRVVDKKTKKVTIPQIPSMPNCLSILNVIYQDAANDNPYADLYLIHLEKYLDKYGYQMKQYIEQLLDIYIKELPEGFDISSCINVEPAVFPIFARSPYSYKLIYLLCDFDVLAKTVMTGVHVGIITPKESREWLNAGAKLLRRCFGVIDSYRHTNLTRKDVLEKNQVYQDAIKRFSMKLPESVLTREDRAAFSPFIKKNTATDEDFEFYLFGTDETDETKTESEVLNDETVLNDAAV